MTTALVISIAVPVVAGAILLSLRNRIPRLASDARGIALQTVIVVVVLLAIAGAVAGVLLTRGGQAVGELEETDVTVDLATIKNATLCTKAGGSYSGTGTAGTCS